MLKILVRRIMIAIPTLFFMSILTFGLVSFVPGDAAVAILGDNANPAQIERLREQLRLNEPLSEQYLHWLHELVSTGSLGTSVLNGEPVVQILNNRLSVTLTLVLGTVLASTVLGIALGAFSALRGGIPGRIVDILSFLGSALPSFWIALLLVSIFAAQLRLLPATGFVPFAQSPAAWALSLILPIAAMSIQAMTSKAAQSRDQIKDVLGRDFVRVQIANGFSRRSILLKHVFRSASPVILTTVGLLFVGLVSGTVVIEVVFSLPGMGQAVVWATLNNDIPVVQGAVLYFTAITLAVNFIIDLLYTWVDPRVRLS